jgi:hypothetical protein
MRFTTILLLAGLGVMGCNPSDFNTILDKAPVQELGTPGASTGSLFVLPLPVPNPSTNIAARMLISRKDSAYLGVADYDMNGKVTLKAASDAEKTALGGYSVNSAAVRPDGLVILGTPRFDGGATPSGRVSTLTIGSKPDGSPSFGIQSGLPGDGRMGISVATGNITGPASGDFVAVGDNSVQLLGTDPSTPIAGSSCEDFKLGNSTDFYAFRPLVVADLLAPNANGAGVFDEIVLSGQGRVLFVQYDVTNVVKGKIELPCPSKVLLGVAGSFGTSLAAGDFDGDGHMDLAVGAPPNHVYVYFGPLDAATTYDVDIVGATATQLGKQIAAYTMPGQATAQLMVADPAAPSPGGVGEVTLYNIIRGTAGTPGTAQAVATLFDSNKDSDPGLFGLNLGGLQFNTGLCNPVGGVQLVPWASLGPNLFTFFAYVGPGAPADPRCFK